MRSRKWLWPALVVILLGAMLAVWTRVASPVQPAAQRAASSTNEDEKFRNQGPAPRITLSVNCLSTASPKEGLPLHIKAVLGADHAEDRTIPFLLSKPDGAWGDFVSVEIRDGAGRIVSGLDVRPAYRTRPSISINGDLSGALVWIVYPTEGKLLAPGQYAVVAVLDSTPSTDENSWRGATRSSPSMLTVKPRSAVLSGSEARIAALVEIRIHDILKENEAALSAANRYLSEHPRDRMILEEKADVLASTGNFREALATYDAALESIPQIESPHREAPQVLLIKRAKAEQALRKAGQN